MTNVQRFRDGFDICLEGIAILRSDKRLWVYGFIAFMIEVTYLFSAGVALPVWALMPIGVFFYDACIAHHVMWLIKKRDVSIGETLKACLIKWHALLLWAMIASLFWYVPFAAIEQIELLVGNWWLLSSFLLVLVAVFQLGWSLAMFFTSTIVTIEALKVQAAIRLSYIIFKNRLIEVVGGVIAVLPVLGISLFYYHTVTGIVLQWLFFTVVDCIATTMYYHYHVEVEEELEAFEHIEM